ncbi:MAG TPA: hypothetical protein P5280_16810 [Cyclobacteriaceae bacterium]|nr:hypothetical protein [Cyclobacteriaceae bacterium]
MFSFYNSLSTANGNRSMVVPMGGFGQKVTQWQKHLKHASAKPEFGSELVVPWAGISRPTNRSPPAKFL